MHALYYTDLFSEFTLKKTDQFQVLYLNTIVFHSNSIDDILTTYLPLYVIINTIIDWFIPF